MGLLEAQTALRRSRRLASRARRKRDAVHLWRAIALLERHWSPICTHRSSLERDFSKAGGALARAVSRMHPGNPAWDLALAPGFGVLSCKDLTRGLAPYEPMDPWGLLRADAASSWVRLYVQSVFSGKAAGEELLVEIKGWIEGVLRVAECGLVDDVQYVPVRSDGTEIPLMSIRVALGVRSLLFERDEALEIPIDLEAGSGELKRFRLSLKVNPPATNLPPSS